MNNLEDTFADLSAFSLENSFNDNIYNASKDDYYFLIYICAALLLIIITMLLIYKLFFNKKRVRFSENCNEIPNGLCGA
jgi:hypothetical protein